MNNDIKRHFRIDFDNDEKLLLSVRQNKTSYTEEVNKTLRKGFTTTDVIKKIDKMIEMINDCQFKLYKIEMLEKQHYSDMEFPERTDPKKNKNLNNFYAELKKDKYNE